MTRGVPKDLSVKAQEQYEKQLRLVTRLKAQREKAMTHVLELNDKITVEKQLLRYYGQHPLVVAAEPQEAPNVEVKDWEDQELPLEVSK